MKPRKKRDVLYPPNVQYFKPQGVPMNNLDTVWVTVDEYEAIRLADYEKLKHEEAAKKMNISRPTFTRLYDKARKNIAKAFVEAKAIFIQGGNYVTDNYWYRCYNCHETMISMKPAKHCRKCDSDNIIQLNNQPENAE